MRKMKGKTITKMFVVEKEHPDQPKLVGTAEEIDKWGRKVRARYYKGWNPGIPGGQFHMGYSGPETKVVDPIAPTVKPSHG